MSDDTLNSVLRAAVMKPGRKENGLIKLRIHQLLIDHGFLYAEEVRTKYTERFGEGIGWNTVHKYLQKLTKEGSAAVKTEISMGARGRFVIYEAVLE